MYGCTNCGARSEVRVGYCPLCAAMSSYLPIVVGPVANVLPDEAVVSAAELYGRETTWLKLDSEFESMLGRVPARTPTIIAVHGGPGAGKTTWSFRWADQLAATGVSPVLINQLEEGTGSNVVNILRRLEITRSDVLVCCMNDWAKFIETVREVGARAVIIDSLSLTVLKAEDLARFVRETKTILTFVLQATKAGQARGSLGLLHIADVVLHLAGNRFELRKSRYAPLREGQSPWLTT